MRCDTCSTESPSGSRFCDDCGASLDKPCLRCGEVNRGVARFCNQCGTAFAGISNLPSTGYRAAEGELKQVTAMFADVRGSTHLIQALDPEAAMGQLDPAVRLMVDAVERFGGVVNKQQGDGIMALFGVPNACEDHAVRACLASRAIIDGVHRLPGCDEEGTGIAIRVGLASGNVVVRATGSDATDFDAIGITVHIASRMEQLAEPGTVQITGQTARLARGFAQVKALPPVLVKGIAEPVEAFRLLSATERPSWEVRATRARAEPVRRPGGGAAAVARGAAAGRAGARAGAGCDRRRRAGQVAPGARVSAHGPGRRVRRAAGVRHAADQRRGVPPGRRPAARLDRRHPGRRRRGRRPQAGPRREGAAGRAAAGCGAAALAAGPARAGTRPGIRWTGPPAACA